MPVAQGLFIQKDVDVMAQSPAFVADVEGNARSDALEALYNLGDAPSFESELPVLKVGEERKQVSRESNFRHDGTVGRPAGQPQGLRCAAAGQMCASVLRATSNWIARCLKTSLAVAWWTESVLLTATTTPPSLSVEV